MELKLAKLGAWRHAIIALLALCFLAFSTGAFVAEFRLFPYKLVFANAFAYIHATRERKATENKAKTKAKTVPPAGRVAVDAKPEAYSGYTFMTFDVIRPSTARLIDMEGKIVHEWHRSFSEICPNHPRRTSRSPDSAIAWRFGQLFPNGDIIVSIKAAGVTPDGYALAKLDKDSNLIWVVPDNFHHHFSVAEDGRIYGLMHQWRYTDQRPVSGAPYLPRRVLEDFVVVLSPDGRELTRVSLLEAMTAPGYRELVNSDVFNKYNTNTWDRLHPNDVEIIGPDFASHHEFLKPGMVLVSLRDLDALIALDLESRTVSWAMRGGWQRQHDPDLLSNGNVLLFDNYGLDDSRHSSRVLEVDLESARVVWSYEGSAKQRFRSARSGGEQRLPNGNTLISVDGSGRIIEVTPEGSIVWDYRDVRLHHATRFSKDWLKFIPQGLATRGIVADSANQ
jgi:hypothetical protein